MNDDNRQRYVVAVKRGQPAEAAQAMLDALQREDGVQVLGSHGSRAQISAGADAVERLQSKLSSMCHIEPVISREHE